MLGTPLRSARHHRLHGVGGVDYGVWAIAARSTSDNASELAWRMTAQWSSASRMPRPMRCSRRCTLRSQRSRCPRALRLRAVARVERRGNAVDDSAGVAREVEEGAEERRADEHGDIFGELLGAD